ncbi:MAG: hypothetical protein GC205_03410 [Bacteroidetes bacterium]|nr:hypothetical protein [Bacteroidota bacterium]
MSVIICFQPGDVQHFERLVTKEHLAAFESGQVHPVYATFALARDAEWVCRLFVLAMKEAHEEGIGTYVSVEHLAPARLGSTVVFKATLLTVQGNRVRCRYEAFVGEELIARGEQEQRILHKSKVEAMLSGEGE